jgi:hypothetical protein
MRQEATIQLELTLQLPDTLAREAAARGLLASQGLETLLRAELQRQRTENFFAAADRLASVSLAPLTEAEVEAEIQAARAEKRNTDAHRS